jgi:hypothetical protein
LETLVLDDNEFHASFAAPMREITGMDREVVDLQPHNGAIAPPELSRLQPAHYQGRNGSWHEWHLKFCNS